MRYTKYIELTLGLIIFSLFFIYIFEVDEPNIDSIILFISADLLMKISLKIYSNRLRSQGNIVLIKQNESNRKKFFNILSLVVILFLTIYTLTDLESSLKNKIGIILPLYVGLASFLFSNKSGDFYVDSLGFIQPEPLKKNYLWNEIENFRINDNSIEFKLHNKDYRIDISDNTKTQLKKIIKVHNNLL